MSSLSPGQEQALRELHVIQRRSRRVTWQRLAHSMGEPVVIKLTVVCRISEEEPPLQEPLCDVEHLYVLVGPDFPFQIPQVMVDHARFARLPHVVWALFICLYTSADDWDPGKGMLDLVDRLLTWLRRAGNGTLPVPPSPGIRQSRTRTRSWSRSSSGWIFRQTMNVATRGWRGPG